MASELFRTLVRAEYTLLSTPLRAADRAAAQRFPADSPLRITLERGIDTLDALAERLLGTESVTEAAPTATAKPKPKPRPTAEPNRPTAEPNRPTAEPTDDSDDLNSEANNSENANAQDANAEDVTSEQAPVPASAEDPGHAGEVERVAEELREEQDEAPLSGELAAAPEDERQRMADLRARHLVEEFEAEQRARHEQFEQS